VVSKEHESVEIDWAADSAFRFFPIEQDPILGWRLHLFDIATNKALALSARSETRDYIDMIELHRKYPLASICWAACGKDPGFTPHSLLKMMRRFAKIDPARVQEIQARNLDPVELKETWIQMSAEAGETMTRLADTNPDLPTGVAFLDKHANPCWPGPSDLPRIHRPSLRGCWPRLNGLV
jgi:hypothetical protein